MATGTSRSGDHRSNGASTDDKGGDRGLVDRVGFWLRVGTFAVAVIAILGYVVFIIYMLNQVGEKNEVVWTRTVLIFGGAEAIAFAAVGYIFGREVNRQRADSAELDAKDARKDAKEAGNRIVEAEKEAAEEKTKGKSLARSVMAKQSTRTTGRLNMGGQSQNQNQAGSGTPDVDELAAFAKSLYPDL